MFEIRDFSELVGISGVMEKWKRSILDIKPGDIVFIYGFSGTGKTTGVKLLTQNLNTIWLDTDNCEHSKYVYDRILKFHNWKPMFDTDDRQKVIVIDGIECFIKIERNILNILTSYIQLYQDQALPIILIGDNEIAKRMGDMKKYLTETIFLPRLKDASIFLFLKSRLPRNKIKLNELMQIAEKANGNMYQAVQMVQLRLKKKLGSFKHDKHYIFDEIFECNNPDTIAKLLQEDTWMHPLKLHENAIKVLSQNDYYDFLKEFLMFEQWQPSSLAYIYLGEHVKKYDKKPLVQMDFSKLLSYLSTRKKYKKLNYEFLSQGNINGRTKGSQSRTQIDRN